MITLSVAYNDNSEQVINDIKEVLQQYPLINLVTYHENILNERKKAFKLKGGFSAREAPFAVLYDEDKNPIRAFYSEAGECTADYISSKLSKYLVYASKSN